MVRAFETRSFSEAKSTGIVREDFKEGNEGKGRDTVERKVSV